MLNFSRHMNISLEGFDTLKRYLFKSIQAMVHGMNLHAMLCSTLSKGNLSFWAISFAPQWYRFPSYFDVNFVPDAEVYEVEFVGEA